MSDDPYDLAEATSEPAKKLGQQSASTQLVEIALELYEFGVSTDGETYAIPSEGPRVLRMLRGGKTSLRAQLAREYFTRYRKAASQAALADALAVVQGFAEGEDEAEVFIRVGKQGEALWLDLGDATGRAIRVTGRGWSLAESSPMLFKRTAVTAVLPEPESGTDIAELWQWLNVTAEDRPLVLAWLVHALFASAPHTVLGIFGEQGTGKTTAEKVMVSILDPSPAAVRKPPRDTESWVTAASLSWVVGLDNLSDMPAWLSDSIARAVTGEGDIRRKLYTDGDAAVFSFRRCIVLNGIDLGALRPDLAERMVPIDLERISEQDRLEEAELWPRWAEAHPRILGALLDLAARVMRVLPSVELESKPRMADFARVLAAVDSVLGTEGYKRYTKRALDLAADGLSGDPLAMAIRDTISTSFEGTSAELLAHVTPDVEKWRPPKGWPATARQTTTQLRRIAPSLRKIGWTVTDLGADNHRNALRWHVVNPEQKEKACEDPRAHSQDSHAASAASEREGEYEPSTYEQTGDCCHGGPVGNHCQLCRSSPTYWKAATA